MVVVVVLICISMIMSDVRYLFSVHIGHSVSSLGHLKIRLFVGNSPAVQWSGLGAFTNAAWVPSLVRELRSCKLLGVIKKKKKKIRLYSCY